ncbi:MAG: c-type cytochrome [Flavobacteriales bacterium]|nr:c-type cytochrome [Flavobacteriales bacterium]MBL6872703.1 c-type cytochrome [Flavobacteriales bacterium]
MKKFGSPWFTVVFMFSSLLFVKGQDGEVIYKQNCTACHKFGQKLIGPDLTGVNEKRSEGFTSSLPVTTIEIIGFL